MAANLASQTDAPGEDRPTLAFTVTPPPTADELEALTAALLVLRSRREEAAAVAPSPSVPSRWARAGRQEATRARQRAWERGWRGGRDDARR